MFTLPTNKTLAILSFSLSLSLSHPQTIPNFVSLSRALFNSVLFHFFSLDRSIVQKFYFRCRSAVSRSALFHSVICNTTYSQVYLFPLFHLFLSRARIAYLSVTFRIV